MGAGSQAIRPAMHEADLHGPGGAALHVDIALQVIRQQMSWPNHNPVSLIKEASDKQKVDCKFVERAAPPRPGTNHPQYRHQVIWEGQVCQHAGFGNFVATDLASQSRS